MDNVQARDLAQDSTARFAISCGGRQLSSGAGVARASACYGAPMRRIFVWLVAGLVGFATYWGCSLFFVAREGIGPGDSLSATGRAIPVLVAVVVFAVVAWRSSKSA